MGGEGKSKGRDRRGGRRKGEEVGKGKGGIRGIGFPFQKSRIRHCQIPVLKLRGRLNLNF